MPAELQDQNIPEYLRNRLEMQDSYLKVIDDTFEDADPGAGPRDGARRHRASR